MAQQRALEQHLRLESPQSWSQLVKTDDAYLSTMYTGTEAVAMDIDAISAQTTCTCCGETGHTKADYKFKDAECRTGGKTGHLARKCRSGGKGGKSKGKGKGEDKNFHSGCTAARVLTRRVCAAAARAMRSPTAGSHLRIAQSAVMSVTQRRFAEHAQHTRSRRHRIPTRTTKRRLGWCGLCWS